MTSCSPQPPASTARRPPSSNARTAKAVFGGPRRDCRDITSGAPCGDHPVLLAFVAAAASAACRVSRMNPQTKQAGQLSPVGEEARRLCQALLRMDTTNPPGNERICADYLSAALSEVGYRPEILEAGPGRANLIVRHRGS